MTPPNFTKNRIAPRRQYRRVMSTCPYCHAEILADTNGIRIYACDTSVDKTTGVYGRMCGKGK